MVFDPSKAIKKMIGPGINVPRYKQGRNNNDLDGDGISDIMDCQPRNMFRQDENNKVSPVYINLKEAAEEYDLEGETFKDFIAFFIKRFPYNSDKQYMLTLARRFSNKYEWANADLKSQKVLLSVNPAKYKAFKKATEDGTYPDYPHKVKW